jgi:acetyltransferase-like isoleucine patch superfamily enzyme
MYWFLRKIFSIKKYMPQIVKKTAREIIPPPYPVVSDAILQAGKMSFHNGNFIIQGSQKVKIGSWCAIAKNVSIITENHDYNFPALAKEFYDTYFYREYPWNGGGYNQRKNQRWGDYRE